MKIRVTTIRDLKDEDFDEFFGVLAQKLFDSAQIEAIETRTRLAWTPTKGDFDDLRTKGRVSWRTVLPHTTVETVYENLDIIDNES